MHNGEVTSVLLAARFVPELAKQLDLIWKWGATLRAGWPGFKSL